MEYRPDKMKEIDLEKIGRKIRKRCASVKSIRIVSVSGAMYTEFASPTKQGRDNGGAPYGAYILFGGWGDDGMPSEVIMDRPRRAYSIWGGEFACVSAGSSRGDSRWGSWGDWDIWGDWRRWGDWDRWGPLDLQPAEDMGHWWGANPPIGSDGGSGIDGIREVDGGSRGKRSKKFLGARESSCVRIPMKSTEAMGEKGAV